MKLKPTRLVHVLGIGTAFSILGDSTLYTVLPDPQIAGSVGLSAIQVGWLLGINRLARIAFNGPIGALADRWPRRRMLIGALAIGACSTLMYALVNSMVLWLVARILWGLAWSGIWIVGQAVLLDVADEQSRGRLSGLYQKWFFIGVGGSALVAGVLTDHLGFRGGLVVSTILTGLAWLIWLIGIPETPSKVQPSSQHRIRFSVSQITAIVRLALPVFAIRFVLAGVVASTTILWLGDLSPSMPASILKIMPLASLTGGLVAVRTASSLLGAHVVGWAADRFGWRWRLTSMVLGLGAAGMWVMGARLWVVAILGAQLAAIAGSGVQTVVPALVADQFQAQDSGKILGWIYTLGDLASALGPPSAVGLMQLVSLSGVYRWCAIGLAIFGGLAMIEGWRKLRGLRLKE